MTTFTESEHPRGAGGKFAAKQQSEQDGELSAAGSSRDDIAQADRDADAVLADGIFAMSEAMRKAAGTVRERQFAQQVRAMRPDAVGMTTDIYDDYLEITGFENADGTVDTGRESFELEVDDIQQDLNEMRWNGMTRDSYVEARNGTGHYTLDLTPATGSNSPKSMIRQAQDEANAEMIRAAGKAMATQVRGRHPDTEAVIVYAGDADDDEVEVDALRMSNGGLVQVQDLDDDTRMILWRAFSENEVGRGWAPWAGENGIADDNQPTIVSLKHLLGEDK